MTSNGYNTTSKSHSKGIPNYKKYSKQSATNWLDPSSKLKPSDLSKSSVDLVADDYPMIIEFNNIQDNTCQVHSTVDIDQPLFQPSPKVVVFEDYAPFAIHEKKIYFRNNDSVARRIKVHQPKSPFFELSAPKTSNGEPLKQTKIAAGMEIYYVVRFKPQQVHEYSLDLICSTEREKFIVPVRAVGMQPRMTFPDEISFGTCAVKSTTRKTLLVQNVGSSVARFSMRATQSSTAFTCPCEEMVVEAGASQMIELFFSPPSAKTIDGEIEVEFANHLRCYITVSGVGRNVDVSLSTPSVSLDPSYISLSSQKTMRIKNTSDVPISFVWKSFSNMDEEENERGRLLQEINRMEAIEQIAFRERLNSGFYDGLEKADDESVSPQVRADEATLMRKYRNLRTALDNDPMQFVDDIFEVTPVSGNVWARSEIEITITFRPDTAAKYTCLSYLDISGRQDRLSLHLSGQGIGPHAELSFDVLDVGDVFINDQQSYDISITNKGDIPAQWSFLPPLTRFGTKFDFSPKQGYLIAGQSQPINVKFESDVLGEFSEVFRFSLQGNDDVLSCQIKGHVVGPTFHFDCNKLDFGIVSFDCLHSTKLRLVNTSKIAMVFNLHVPQDGTFLKKEFDLDPKDGSLSPGEHVDVSVDFVPSSVKVYDYSLAVDVLGVGDSLLSVPISAECRVSTLRLMERDILFGDVFIRYPYEKELLLYNPSDVLHTKFEMMPQLAYTKYFATYEAEPSVGIIEPGDTMRIKMRLIADKLANFKVPILISIAGSKEPPLQSTLQYSCIGPKVNVDVTEIRWGNIECLKDSTRGMKITNNSLISAHMKIFLKMARSKFELSAHEMVLEPSQSYDMTVTANLDDSVVIKDEIHIVVDEGDDIMIPLSAKGVGTTMFCGDDLNSLDLGIQLTNTHFERKIVLENKGRRPQQLKWINQTAKDENSVRAGKAKKLNRDGSRLPKHLMPVDPTFTVVPEEITLRPRTATTFTFKGYSSTPALLKEVFTLESKVGKERNMKQIAVTEVRCNIVNPLLEFSLPKVDFLYRWEKDVPALVQKRDIVLRNISDISLTFVLSVEIPFNLSSFEHTLSPGQSVDIMIEFDPLYRDDKMSHVVEKAFLVTYKAHPQRDTIPLNAEIIFPNLVFDAKAVVFGCVLNDSNKTLKVLVTNTSKVVATYEWSFVDEVGKKKMRTSGKGNKLKDNSAAGSAISCEQVFDILPVRSVLQPGESEDVQFEMYGIGNSKFHGTVICSVEGGPDYSLPISGEASTVSYSLDKNIVDFGCVLFTDRKDEELSIVNNGKVSFFFEIFPLSTTLANIIEALPSSGKVNPGDKLKITLRIRPVLPTFISETLMVQIAHFDPVGVQVYCQGIFPSAVVSLPRHSRIGPFGEASGNLAELWEKFTAEALENIATLAATMSPPPAETLPAPFSATSAIVPVFVPPPPAGELEEFDTTLGGLHSPRSQSSITKGPQQMSLDVEMQRLALCYHLSKKVEDLLADPATLEATTATTAGAETLFLQSLVATRIDLKDIVSANYICDFGNVIIGQTKKKVFQVFNASHAGHISWSFEKKYLSGSPFSIEPDRVSKLLEHTNIDFAVKCTARGDQKLGRKTYVLPIEIKGTATVNVLLSGNFCVPDVDLSVEELDFGRVTIGRCKQMFFRMHNTTPVTAQWKLKSVGRDDGRVSFTPSEGSLRAGKNVVICVEYVPTDPRHFVLEKAVKIESNKKSKTLKIIGEGVSTPIRFDPMVLEMSPVVPFTQGDEKIVTVTNNNETAVEIYSLDFDGIYREEEAILSAVDVYDASHLLRSDPRHAGEGLPREVTVAHALQLASTGEGEVAPVVDVLISAPLRTIEAPRDINKQQDIVVVGPPLSGVSTTAEHLSKKLQLVVKTIDELLEDVSSTNGEMGQLARRMLQKMSASEAQEVSALEQELLAKAEQSKADAEAAYLKAKKGKKGKEIPEEVYATEEVAAYQKFVQSGACNEQNLAEVFKSRMAWNDVGYGVIIDGVFSKYAEETIMLKALCIALPALIVSQIVIQGEAEGYRNRLSALYEAKVAEIESIQRSIENAKKTIARLVQVISAVKEGKGKAAPPSPLADNAPIEVAIPAGDEPWIRVDSGGVAELDPLDYKALDNKQKLLYTKQLLYQNSLQVVENNAIVDKIRRIWTPETGLKTTHDEPVPASAAAPADSLAGGGVEVQAEGEAGAAPVDGDQAQVTDLPAPPKTMLYCEYVERVIPAITAFQALSDQLSAESAAAAAAESSAAAAEVVDAPAAGGAVEGEEGGEGVASAGPVKDRGLFEIVLEGDENEAAMVAVVMALLPAPKVPPPDKNAVPLPKTFQVVRKPITRMEKKHVRQYEISPINADGSVVEGPRRFRWIIEPFGSVQFKVLFKSEAQGKFETGLRFEVLGTQQSYTLHCSGSCELPNINRDTRNIFMRRVKTFLPGSPIPQKKYVIADNLYSFGPLLLFKKPEWRNLSDNPSEDEVNKNQLVQTNVDVLRLSNNGRYKCTVELGFRSNAEDVRGIFMVEPNVVELEEGETKDVKIWAFPTAVKEYSNTLVVCVTNNPAPLFFDVKCWGVEPTVELDGPWKETLAEAEAAVAACTDKKLIKDLQTRLAALKDDLTLDFNRLLIQKVEQRSFQFSNTSLLPIAFEVDPGDFRDSQNMSIFPLTGVVPANTTIPITLSFTSPEPLMLTGKFSLRYSDAEGGLQTPARVGTKGFRGTAEAYKIIAVSLTAAGQEEGGSEIDYGLIRVGDYAVQTVKMANRGKYKIGYKFIIPKTIMSNLVKIEPDEGLIESGNALAEIKVTFCCATSEISLKGNKDIKVQISEPLTGEIVETFPLYINAVAKYNQFRMQPAKGISFGAIRFDSDSKSKRVELRNEGNFEFVYAICPALSEVDELDAIDPAALACYAYSVPAAIRKEELGDTYLQRIGSASSAGGGGAAGGGKDAKGKAPPAKGKAAPVASAGAESTKGASLNPLVVDPDNLNAAPVPTDPLVVGSFSVFPRIGIVQPGQSVGIDAKFDPSGCRTVHERLRFCISGVNPKDAASITLKNFELTGESCVPAIVTDDNISIFEEQEVVASLSESVGSGKDGSSAKIEKLSCGKVVYAEAEKVLAFGPVMCSNGAARGVVERIKITNPTKIDTKVNFKIALPGATSAAAPAAPGAGGKDAKGKPKAAAAKDAPPAEAPAPLAFTVQPESWDIPPHEYRFVNVYFNPTEIKSYRAVFSAEVDTAGSSTTAVTKLPGGSGSSLVFDLAGSGTLPCISLEQPTQRQADGSLALDFGKVHINRNSKRRIVFSNDGVMPVTCLFDMTGDEDFVFPYRGASLTLQPGEKGDVVVTFNPTKVFATPERQSQIKLTVLNNQFDSYVFKLTGTSYSCEALIDTRPEDSSDSNSTTSGEQLNQDEIKFSEINLAEGSSSASHTITLKSRSQKPIKFEFSTSAEDAAKVLSFSPKVGHLGPGLSHDIVVTFSTAAPIQLNASDVKCTLTPIEYNTTGEDIDRSLWGIWDDAMKSARPASAEDLAAIEAANAAQADYLVKVEAEKKKGKKGKPVPLPEPCNLQLGPVEADGTQIIYEIVKEPEFTVVAGSPVEELHISCTGVADSAKYSCAHNGENVPFKPTFMFQSTVHKFTFTNESNINLPLNWSFEDIKRQRTTNTRASTTRGTLRAPVANVPCPFSIEPEECTVGPKQSKEFTLRFQPVEVDDFVYMLRGETLPTVASSAPAGGAAAAAPASAAAATDGSEVGAGPVRMVIRGTAKRPLCHIDMVESQDYLTRRPSNMLNEFGMKSPIETSDLRVVQLESTGLKTRNTYRFHISNPTADNFEFGWEAIGEPSPAWRCVQSSGMLFSGKRVEMVFEFLPEETSVAEAFFKFRLPSANVEQLFLFAGEVSEPKVALSTSRIDFHAVMLGGDGGTEVVYLENSEHLPFNFSFEKSTLLQLEGPNGPVLDISPKSGTVLPHGKCPITFHFGPQEEVVYNFNIQIDVKRKPNKLSINVKGEGYAVHPLIQLEQSEEQASVRGGNRFLTLRPAPSVNYADFGAVQVLDSISKKLTVLNTGKYNFDYVWDIDAMGPMLSLTGGKMGGTLQKAGEMVYTITFAPQREQSLDGCMLTFTVAGKYVYNIWARGNGVQPALRFSFMHFDFGNCFVTSPGGSTVVEEAILRLVNHDPSSNIAVECAFQKTRALWVECPPTVMDAGSVLDVPIRFAPRDVKDYEFVVPFVVNGTTKVNLSILGKGTNARVELVSASNRRTNFGVINVGSESRKSVSLVNRSKKAVAVQLLEDGQFGGGALESRCVSFFPKSEFMIAPKETVAIQVVFAPNKRISNFSEDLLIRYAGLNRKLLTVAGKAQGLEVSLDTDSLPFGTVVMDSQKFRKVTLENSGDLPITFQWMESTFGPHFSISPLSGKVNPASEVSFNVTFKPKYIDEDIRQEGMMLQIPGISPLLLTCSGGCIAQPSESIQTLQFKSLARKSEVKTIKITNPTDKDWYISPSLQGGNWSTPHEFKVPMKSAADLAVTYFPLTMAAESSGGGSSDAPDTAHQGQLFLALPDGSAQLYKLRGIAGPPECSGNIAVSTPAKKPVAVSIKLVNWLSEQQKLNVTYEFTEKASPACFVVVANAVEIGPSGTKEFPARFLCYCEGSTKGTITFTNPITREYAYYSFVVTSTAAEVLEVLSLESPVRQTARTVLSLENPLPADTVVGMGRNGDGKDWWTSDCKYVRVNELCSLMGASEGSFEIEYRPLAITDQPKEHTVTISTKELGTYTYKLVVKATPPALRQTLRFEVPLGSMQAETFMFRAYNSTKVDFACSVNRVDVFAVAKSLTVEPASGGWEGEDIRLPISFEPTEIGEVRDLLTLTSAEGGEYLCELIATCVAPLPQGPFNLNAGRSLEIPFRNCFSTSCNWTFATDSPAFTLSATTATVAAKTQGVCNITFAPREEHRGAPGGIMNAKLFVTCSSKPEVVPWVFYLRGKYDDEYFAQLAQPGGGKKK